MRCFSSPAPSAGLSCNLKPHPRQCLRAILGSIITCPHPRYRVQRWQRWAYIWTHPVYTHQRPPQTYQHLSTRDTWHTTHSRVLNPKHSLTANTTPDSSEASTAFWPFMSTSEKYCNFWNSYLLSSESLGLAAPLGFPVSTPQTSNGILQGPKVTVSSGTHGRVRRNKEKSQMVVSAMPGIRRGFQRVVRD